MFIRGILAAIAVFFAVPALATQCPYWKIDGDYVIRQSNAIDVAVHLERDGDRLTGQARFYSTRFGHVIAGPLEGYVDGDHLHFRVRWFLLKQKTCLKYDGLIPVWCWTDKYDENGIYEGTISAHGEVEGSNYPFERPNARTHWFLKSELECREIMMRPPGYLGHPQPTPTENPITTNPPPIAPTHRDPGTLAEELPPIATDPRQPDRVTDMTNDVGTGTAPVPPAPGAPVARPIHNLGKREPNGARDRCMSGFVWREARAGDHVCVTPSSRQRAAQENRLAAERRNPEGAYGPQTCLSGYVWREAFAGDTVCVTPSVRSLVREENRQDAARRRTNQGATSP